MSRTRFRKTRRAVGLGLAGVMGPTVMRALHRSLDLDVRGAEYHQRLREQGERILYSVWHGRMLTPIWCHRNQGITVLVSSHADGEALTRVMAGLGFGAARGSSTRGGASGLKGLVRAARAEQDLAITPDGPRGPPHEVKTGLIVAAQLTGAHIVPLSAAAERAWHLNSWDSFQIPRPGTRTYVEYAPPVWVPRETDEAGREALRDAVQHAMDELTVRVDTRARGGAMSNPRQSPNASADDPRTEQQIRATMD